MCDSSGGGYEGAMDVFLAVMAVTLAASTTVAVGRLSEPTEDGGEKAER